MINFRPLGNESMAMSLDDAAVRKIARLARLRLSDGEVTAYAQQLSGILDFVEQMNAIDTQAVVPLSHPLDLTARLRPDTVTETDGRETFQQIAPQVESGLYLVPKVIE
jgi:aspartyl-tRNA(Asn)/glutamyl-tRNA(Gln) amidotransferase subunit C